MAGKVTKTVAERFRSKTRPVSGGCIVWTGGTFGNGYGMFYPGPDSGAKKLLAHRWAYEHSIGGIPDGCVLDHLCKNILCVNPEHLEPVSQRQNVLRGGSFAALNAMKTHCASGHEFSGSNVIFRKGRGGRECRECKRARDRKRRPRRRAA